MTLRVSERLQQKPVTDNYAFSRSFLGLCEIKKDVERKDSNDYRTIKKILHSILIKWSLCPKYQKQ